MTHHEELCWNAVRAISLVANDWSVSPEANRASLIDLRDDIDMRLAAIKTDQVMRGDS